MVRYTSDSNMRFDDRKFSSRQEFIAPALQAALTCAARDSGEMIDIGCADGLLITQFARLRPAWKCLGIDVSSPNVNVAIRNSESDANVAIAILDVVRDRLPQANIVIANSIFHLVDDPLRALHNLRDSVAHDGQVIISVPDSRTSNRLIIWFRKFILLLGLGRILEKQANSGTNSFLQRASYLTVLPKIDIQGIEDVLQRYGFATQFKIRLRRTHFLQPGHSLVVMERTIRATARD
jgi:2-polyprenyl-3-methyl-5-hydroxy-6-metoxy-1,4-benzoquinol methylase